MKVCILAAGFGSRLMKYTPKAVVEILDDITILDLQIENLMRTLKVNLKDIIIVVGYKKDLITNRYPELTFAYNDSYYKTGTAKSLLEGLKQVDNDDVIWINGDVVFDSDILDLIIENQNSNLVMVDNSNVRDIEIKYNMNEEGNVKQVSKDIENGIGELIGINFIKKDCLPTFISNLERSDDTDYFDRAIQLTINSGFNFTPLEIKDKFSIEIDHLDELELAQDWLRENFDLN
jgi:choline kinase